MDVGKRRGIRPETHDWASRFGKSIRRRFLTSGLAELRRRPGNGQFEFRNFGVGGDLAYNALQRLPDVLACRPDKVIVWVGGNDVLTLVSRKVQRFFTFWKRLPRTPSPDWFHENLAEIARRLKRETAADIGLCSLPPIGEAPDSDDPFQSEFNRRIKEYSAIVAAIAHEERCGYVPLHEALTEAVRASPWPGLHGVQLSSILSRCFSRTGAAAASG
ncbi:GDSL-type esterase/lipase family protein [Mesorhizobium sp. M0074]|uniref:SGNH/GDSL hydrolase family protein n=1 Tax=Mesorhizobium sp. M0074 TaxID=2956869 RepID=UPI00333C960E